MAGESQGRVYDTVRSMRHNEGIRELLRKGENPYEALVKRGHELGMHVYASIRMNDNHFSGLQLEDMAEASIEGLTPLRKQHPEWCLGPRQAPKWFAASWNFAIPADPGAPPAERHRGLQAGRLGRSRAGLAAPRLPPAPG